jgi:hypothetical protein
MTLLLPTPPSYSYHVTNDDSPGSSTTYGTTVTAGTANTKGNWVAIHSTISYDLFKHRVVFTVVNTAVTSEQMLVDLGIGPDTSNVTVVASNLVAGSASNAAGQIGRVYMLPLFIPAGTLLFARCQSNIASNTVLCAVQSWGGSDRPGMGPIVTYIEDIGAATASSTGTAITPGNSGALGSYAQLTAASANDYVGFTLAGGCTNTVITALSQLFSIGIGAATEVDIGTLHYWAGNASEWINAYSDFVPWDVPAGTRIAARGSSTGTADTSQFAVGYGFISG